MSAASGAERGGAEGEIPAVGGGLAQALRRRRLRLRRVAVATAECLRQRRRPKRCRRVTWKHGRSSAAARAERPRTRERRGDGLERDGSRRVKAVVGERNFDSKASRELLAGRGIVNAIAPRDAGLLRAGLREVRFQQLRQRRGQTEARIAIFKNAFLGARLLAKGHQNQVRQVAWTVLTHNLWLLAGLPKRELRALRKAS